MATDIATILAGLVEEQRRELHRLRVIALAQQGMIKKLLAEKKEAVKR